MTLGERMKEYEMVSRTRLIRRMPVIIRLDGCHFHTLTRGLDKPFDKDLMNIMQQTMLELCNKIQGCVLGYTQSDEITLVLVDYQRLESMAWYDNQVQKMCSVAASIATQAFEKALTNDMECLTVEAMHYSSIKEENKAKECWNKQEKLEEKKYKANFDARVFNLPTHEVVNNLIWRQQDAIRNSVSSLAQSLFPHKELQNVNSKEMKEKIEAEMGIRWEDLPIDCQRGTAAIKDKEGKWILDKSTPIFTENRKYIEDLIDIKSV